ncbi:maleate isomerase [Paraburkholderia sp. BL18I3N2]|uniref:maleate cis-trans isomerase family protein n=1 Tax=unclassified Paraburkholderia TaxID=2615204 RepID=UPI000D085B73|nr:MULTISPECIES: Asp/Glu/hydantoin racemase [unclassified Paraburkholderia]PRX19622.1 maleate isomerase [Paraburkholderia sp. BL18I3N2]PRX95909.1 maleate isomerase [Paraburkholderia sp. BL25I1N1]TDY15643.1 maleate isomerase [Paraburkholderia sp. BL6665CI2N2]
MLETHEKSGGMSWTAIPYRTDAGFGARAQIGMVVIDCDQTLSHEARAMLAIPGVALFESRISSSPDEESQPISEDLLADTFDGIEVALRQINSRLASDVVALGCTSAAVVIGPENLKRCVRAIHPKAEVTDPFTGILSGLRALGSARVGFISPYPKEVANIAIEKIEEAGFQVSAVGEFDNGHGTVRDDAPFISPDSIADAVRQIVRSSDVDTIVISCTQMRAATIIEDLETETGKAIVTSNQALCWHALRLSGCEDLVPGWGRLFRTAI